MKKLLILLLLLPAAASAASAANVPGDTLEIGEYTTEYLDTVNVGRKKVINDYSMIGFNYGVAFCNMDFNPTKRNSAFNMQPNHFSVMYTHYEKLFNRYPNFALHIGFDWSHEGIAFKTDPETGKYLNDIDGATRMAIEVMEVPVMAGFHADALNLIKFQAAAGVYGGYRKSIERSGERLDPAFTKSFRDYEFRFDYGMMGSAGIALMFDPIEIHFNALVRWGWQSLYEPDYSSKYYYRYAYPLDVIVTAGIHFQLGKRTGRTSADIRREAKETVYGTTQDSSRQDR